MPVFIPVIPGPSKGWHFGTPWDDTSLQHPLKQPITLSRRVYSLRCPQLLCVSWPSRVRQEWPWVGLFASFCHFRGQSFGYGSIPMKIPFLGGWTSILTQLFWCELQGDRVLTHPHCNPLKKAQTSVFFVIQIIPFSDPGRNFLLGLCEGFVPGRVLRASLPALRGALQICRRWGSG